MSDSPERPNLFFRLTTLAGAAFVVTILALVATMFSDPQAPPARFLNAHGTTLIACEVAAILISGLLAMTVDRRQILRAIRLQEQAAARGPAPGDTPAAPGSRDEGDAAQP